MDCTRVPLASTDLAISSRDTLRRGMRTSMTSAGVGLSSFGRQRRKWMSIMSTGLGTCFGARPRQCLQVPLTSSDLALSFCDRLSFDMQAFLMSSVRGPPSSGILKCCILASLASGDLRLSPCGKINGRTRVLLTPSFLGLTSFGKCCIKASLAPSNSKLCFCRLWFGIRVSLT